MIFKGTPIYNKLRDVKHSAKMMLENIGAKGYVFMLHRVENINLDGLESNEGLKVSPKFLDNFISSVEKNYDFISVFDIEKRLKEHFDKKFIVWTFDDGYKDNLTNALPIFQKHHCPFTVFVASSFPDKNCILWWLVLEEIFAKTNELTLSDGSSFLLNTKQEKEDAFSAIHKKIMSIKSSNFENELNKLFSPLKVDWKCLNERLCLSWNEIKELQKSGICTIGAHTANHYKLRNLHTKNDVFNEIEIGIQRFTQELNGYKPTVFAYPFGTKNEAWKREYLAAKEFNFDVAFASVGGGVKNNSSKYSLPRIALTENSVFPFLRMN